MYVFMYIYVYNIYIHYLWLLLLAQGTLVLISQMCGHTVEG